MLISRLKSIHSNRGVRYRLYSCVSRPFAELRCMISGTFQLVRQGPQKSCGHGLAGAVLHPFSVYLPLSRQSASSAFLLVQFFNPRVLHSQHSAHRSLPSSPAPPDPSQPFPPIYSHCASTSRAACTRQEDGCPCVPQPALPHARTPRLALMLRGHLASESRGTSAALLSANGRVGGSVVGSSRQTSTKHFHRLII